MAMIKSNVSRRARIQPSSANSMLLGFMQCMSPIDIKPVEGNSGLLTASNSLEILNEAKDNIILDIEDGEALIAEISKNISDLFDQRADHEAAINATMSSSESANKIIAENKEAAVRLSKSAPHLNKGLNSVLNEAKACKDLISSFTVQLSDAIALLDQQINALASKRSSIEGTVESHKISLQSYNKIILESKDSISRLSRTLSDISGMGASLASTLSAKTRTDKSRDDGSVCSKYSHKSRRSRPPPHDRDSDLKKYADRDFSVRDGDGGERRRHHHRSRDIPPLSRM